MSVLTSFQGAIGGTTVTYRVLRRDYARRRRWNKTTSTWKSTVSSGDAQETLTEQATPHKGIYEVTTSGMGAPGLIYTYFKNIVSGRIVGARRVTISDGAYLNNPDAAVTTDANKLRVETWTTVAGAGSSRYKARLEDRTLGNTWNNVTSAWAAVVTNSDSRISLSEDADESNLYGAFVTGVGNVSPVRVSYYDTTSDPNCETPLREEDITVTAGSAASTGDAPYKIEAMQAHGVNTVETKLNPTRTPALTVNAEQFSAPCLMMRIVDAAGEPITADLISSIEYSVYRRSDSDMALNTHIDGHYRQSLTVNDVVLSSLQNDYLWDEVDDEGYNFRHQFDIQEYVLLSERGARYDAQFMFTPASGQKFPARFKMYTDG